MIDRSHDLSVARQAEMLGIRRGSIYDPPRPTPPADLALMRWIDELHLDYPFAGSRMLQHLLKPEPGHKVFPYLLRRIPVTAPNQVWAMDITYVPMARGFVYLAAVVDWFSRRVLS